MSNEKDKDRQIFVYFNGEKETRGDPLSITRHLFSSIKNGGKDIETLWNTLSNTNIPVSEPLMMDSIDFILPIIKDVFKVKPLEDGGLSEKELLDLFADFFVYCENLKKNTENLANGSNVIPGTPSPPPTAKKRRVRVSSGTSACG